MKLTGLLNWFASRILNKKSSSLLLCLSLAVCMSDKLIAAPTYTLESGQWQQLVVPGNSGIASVSDLFSDELPADEYGLSWLIYIWNNETVEFIDPGLEGNIPNGQGFWMIQITGEPVVLEVGDLAAAPLSDAVACPAASGCTEATLSTVSSASSFAMIGTAQGAAHTIGSLTFVAPSSAECAQGCSHSEAVAAGLMKQRVLRYEPTTGSYAELGNDDVLGPWESAWFESTDALSGYASS